MKNNKYFIVGTTIFLLVFGLLAYKSINKNDIYDQGVACTMEALQCPDGSYVGRSGEKCEFKKCPDSGSFVGTLRQTSSGFDLLMPSPNTESQGVTYVMPLQVKVSNVLGQIIGKKVEVFGKFVSGNNLQVDRLEELRNSDPSYGDVGVSKTVYINGIKITLNSVIQDNRCPVDVQCIEAGAINSNVTLQSDTDKETRNMASDEVPISFDSYKISIEKINPPRMSKVEPDSKAYVITFKVIPNE